MSLGLAVCRTPPVPPEAAQADRLEHELWRAGALIFSPVPYADYKKALRRAKDHLIEVKAKFAWFRDYSEVQKEYQDLVGRGESLLQTIRDLKKDRTAALQTELAGIGRRLRDIHQATQSLNEGRLARSSLTRAEVAAAQASISLEKGEYDLASRKIVEAEDFLREGREMILSLLARYFDGAQRKSWTKMTEETIAESRARRSTVLVVIKLERELQVYRSGKRTATYGIGLGRFGLSDKLSSGDEATPEGRYRVVRKLGWSQFYKALLLDYPNAEDRREFTRAKKKGWLPASSSIGGQIEIHGGGTEGVTRGCVAVDDEVMDALFKVTEVGTAVTIVGTMKSEDDILAFFSLDGSGGQK